MADAASNEDLRIMRKLNLDDWQTRLALAAFIARAFELDDPVDVVNAIDRYIAAVSSPTLDLAQRLQAAGFKPPPKRGN